jgi:hypothetical protein
MSSRRVYKPAGPRATSYRSYYGAGRRPSYKSYSKKMTAPVSIGTTMRTTKTRDTQSSANRELVFSVSTQSSSDSYSVVSFAINPGLSSLFPILSRQAQCYTRYKMRFNLEFVSSVGTAATGNIVMSINRNRSEPAPSSLSKQMSMAGAVQSNIWSTACYPTNRSMVKPSEKMLYTRYGSILPGEDINLYDMCNVFVGLTGINLTDLPPGTSIGQIYLTYQCKFYDQRVEDVIDDNAFVLYPSFDSTLITQPGNAEALLPYVLGQGDVIYTGAMAKGATPVTGDDADGFTIIFPSAGFYMIEQTLSGQIIADVGGGTLGGTSPFSVQPIGGMVSASGDAYVMSGSKGSGVLLSPYISNGNGYPNLNGSLEQTAYVAHTMQIVQVFASGTYLVGDNQVVGDAWISKSVGTGPFVSGHTANTNETQIYNVQNTTPAYTAIITNSYIQVSPVDVTSAAYFFPTYWSAPSGPASAALTIQQHHKFQAFQGVPHQHQSNKLRKIETLPVSMKMPYADDPDEVIRKQITHYECLLATVEGQLSRLQKQKSDSDEVKHLEDVLNKIHIKLGQLSTQFINEFDSDSDFDS